MNGFMSLSQLSTIGMVFVTIGWLGIMIGAHVYNHHIDPMEWTEVDGGFEDVHGTFHTPGEQRAEQWMTGYIAPAFCPTVPYLFVMVALVFVGHMSRRRPRPQSRS